MMYIGNDLIEAVHLNDAMVPKPGYVGNFKRTLKIKHRELIAQSNTAPEFLVSVQTEKSAPDKRPN